MNCSCFVLACCMAGTGFLYAGDQDNSSSGNGDQQVRLGSPVHVVDPLVPKSLYGKSAVAVLDATLKTEGSFVELSALTGDSQFEEAALDAVHQWRYTPATVDGNPVDAQVLIAFSYRDGAVSTKLEPDPPFPTKPKTPVQDLFSRGELSIVDPKTMKLPKAIYSPDPDYSEIARFVKYQGVCIVGVILGKDGRISDLWVSRQAGVGLDQKALEAVRHWRFEPAMKNGEPVAVLLNVEVTFHLY
jgi:TonB family protein